MIKGGGGLPISSCMCLRDASRDQVANSGRDGRTSTINFWVMGKEDGD